MLTLHYLAQSRAFRILWLLEELKAAYALDYEMVMYERGADYLAPKDLLAIHPLGKAPVLVDTALGETDNALAESALIIEYLLTTYDKDAKFRPSNTNSKAWRDYTFWLHFTEGSLMPPLVMKLILTKSAQKAPFFIRPIIKGLAAKINALLLDGNVEKSLQLLSAHLEDQHWLAGDGMTGADVQLYFAVAAAYRRMGLSDTQYSNILNWLKRCESRPAFIRALNIGGQPF